MLTLIATGVVIGIIGSAGGWFALVGGRARHDPRRRHRQPGRSLLPRAGAAAGPCRRLLVGRLVAGVQRRRSVGGGRRDPARRVVRFRVRLRHAKVGARPTKLNDDRRCPFPRDWRACGWMPGWRACWACLAPPWRRSPKRAASSWTAAGREVRPADSRGLAGGSVPEAPAPARTPRRHRGHDDPVLRRRHRRGRQAGGGGRARRAAGADRPWSAGWPRRAIG